VCAVVFRCADGNCVCLRLFYCCMVIIINHNTVMIHNMCIPSCHHFMFEIVIYLNSLTVLLNILRVFGCVCVCVHT
jgi:hypothetical protein